MSREPLPVGLYIAQRKVLSDGRSPSPELIAQCNGCGRSFLESPYNGDFSHRLPLIFTDGACLNNGYDDARAGYGVSISDDPDGQHSFPYTGSLQRTNQRAELAGVKKGLELLYDTSALPDCQYSCPFVSYRNFVLATDSDYAVRGITEWLPTWRANGFRTSNNGRPPVNQAEFLEIDNLLAQFERMGRTVALWHIPRAFNAQADALANQGARADRGLQTRNRPFLNHTAQFSPV